MVLNTALPVAFAAQFVDTSGHWAQHSIEGLSQRGILNGYPTGEFRPEGAITRAEFAATLVKAEGLDSQFVDNGSNFVDVPSSFWGYRPIETVSDLGLVSGYPGGYFRPGQNITRTEALSMLVKAARVPLPSATETAQILKGYSDGNDVPVWAQPSVAAAIKSGIYAGFPNPGYLQPNLPTTRGEVAKLTDNLLASQNPGNRPSQTVGNSMPQYLPGNNTNNGNYQQGNTLQGRIAIVPSQTIFTGLVTQPVSTDRSQVGDPVSITLDRPLLSSSGDVVIPQNSQVTGFISAIAPTGRLEKNAGMTLEFNRVITPSGQTYPLSAEVNAENGMLKAGSAKGRVGKIAVRTVGGAAVGGAAGAILGAIKGKGKADDYLARGAALGGVVGAASSVIGKGEELVLQPGDRLELKLSQPLSIPTP
jgi:hypothetical protein